MHISISITKKTIIAALLFIVGFVCLCSGIYSLYKQKHALSLDTLKESECRNGLYVTGNIDTYIGKKAVGSNQFTGTSVCFISHGKDYEFYTIPISNKHYIQLMIYDKDVLKKLENFSNGQGEAVYFEGKLIEPPLPFNYAWHENIEGLHTDDVIQSYVIKEIKFRSNKNKFYISIILIALAILIFLDDGGINGILTKNVIDT